MFPLSYELEAIALDNLNDAPGAIASYEQAAATLKDAKSYGLEEFDNNMAESAWRISNLPHTRSGSRHLSKNWTFSRSDNGLCSGAKLIDNAFALPDLSAPTRRHLEQLSREVARGTKL